MIDFYNIESHNKQLTPEEVQKEASKSRPAWAVCYTIDHTTPKSRPNSYRETTPKRRQPNHAQRRNRCPHPTQRKEIRTERRKP